MQHHPPCSREVFRHWWVTIIKTPKVRKMTQASLFDSFYASHQNERVSYVADFADCPCCHFQFINKLIRELDVRERRRGCAEEKYWIHFKRNCRKYQKNPITTGLTDLFWNGHSKATKEQYHNMWWCYSQIILSSLTFLSTWHKRKNTSLCSWNLNWQSSYI